MFAHCKHVQALSIVCCVISTPDRALVSTCMCVSCWLDPCLALFTRGTPLLGEPLYILHTLVAGVTLPHVSRLSVVKPDVSDTHMMANNKIVTR